MTDIYIVFDSYPDHSAAAFIDVEDGDGKSLSPEQVGVVWCEQRGGYWALGPFVSVAALRDRQAATVQALARAEAERDAAKRWCRRTHVLPICGNTARDARSEAIVRSLREKAGGSPDGGCGKPIEWLMAYRCLECGRWAHAECLRQHFAEHGDRSTTLARDLEAARENLEKYGSHSLECEQGILQDVIRLKPVEPTCVCGLAAALAGPEGEAG